MASSASASKSLDINSAFSEALSIATPEEETQKSLVATSASGKAPPSKVIPLTRPTNIAPITPAAAENGSAEKHALSKEEALIPPPAKSTVSAGILDQVRMLGKKAVPPPTPAPAPVTPSVASKPVPATTTAKSAITTTTPAPSPSAPRMLPPVTKPKPPPANTTTLTIVSPPKQKKAAAKKAAAATATASSNGTKAKTIIDLNKEDDEEEGSDLEKHEEEDEKPRDRKKKSDSPADEDDYSDEDSEDRAFIADDDEEEGDEEGDGDGDDDEDDGGDDEADKADKEIMAQNVLGEGYQSWSEDVLLAHATAMQTGKSTTGYKTALGDPSRVMLEKNPFSGAVLGADVAMSITARMREYHLARRCLAYLYMAHLCGDQELFEKAVSASPLYPGLKKLYEEYNEENFEFDFRKLGSASKKEAFDYHIKYFNACNDQEADLIEHDTSKKIYNVYSIAARTLKKFLLLGRLPLVTEEFFTILQGGSYVITPVTAFPNNVKNVECFITHVLLTKPSEAFQFWLRYDRQEGVDENTPLVGQTELGVPKRYLYVSSHIAGLLGAYNAICKSADNLLEQVIHFLYTQEIYVKRYTADSEAGTFDEKAWIYPVMKRPSPAGDDTAPTNSLDLYADPPIDSLAKLVDLYEQFLSKSEEESQFWPFYLSSAYFLGCLAADPTLDPERDESEMVPLAKEESNATEAEAGVEGEAEPATAAPAETGAEAGAEEPEEGGAEQMAVDETVEKAQEEAVENEEEEAPDADG